MHCSDSATNYDRVVADRRRPEGPLPGGAFHLSNPAVQLRSLPMSSAHWQWRTAAASCSTIASTTTKACRLLPLPPPYLTQKEAPPGFSAVTHHLGWRTRLIHIVFTLHYIYIAGRRPPAVHHAAAADFASIFTLLQLKSKPQLR